MGKLFGGGAPKAPAMAPIPKPKLPPPVRMPVETDPDIEAAAARNRAMAMKRKGRLSTIMTDQTSSISGSMGSSGTKLGA